MRVTAWGGAVKFRRASPKLLQVARWALPAAIAWLIPNVAHAELFKCVDHGRTSYQDSPCPGTSTTEVLKVGAAKSEWLGCYEIDFRGFESATPHSIERWRVSAHGADDYDVESLAAPAPAVLHMKKATADEMKMVGDAFGLRLSDGISIKWDKDTPNQKPAGLYRASLGAGEKRILAYFFLANGFAKPSACR